MFFSKFVLIFPVFFYLYTSTFTFVHSLQTAPVQLKADGDDTGDHTYELIRSALGPNSIEVPDCSHPILKMKHITQTKDILNDNKPYFIFTLHANPDDDQCKNANRQRAEISVSVKDAPRGGLITGADQRTFYVWTLRVPSDFKSPNQQTDIFQVQATTMSGSVVSAIRILLMTTTDGKTMMQVKTSGDAVKCKGDFTPFLEKWVTMELDIKFKSGSKGELGINVKPYTESDDEVEDPSTFPVSCQAAPTGLQWKDNYKYARPKWGIKRRKFNGRTDVEIHYDYFRIEPLVRREGTAEVEIIEETTNKNNTVLVDY